MNIFLVIQKENKDQQNTAGEMGTNEYVRDFIRVRGSCMDPSDGDELRISVE